MTFAIMLMEFVGQPTLLYFANPRSDTRQVACTILLVITLSVGIFFESLATVGKIFFRCAA